ncbi:hypothetical protein [Amycolatopsis orientalis]|uniref:hypothetical protein n=1 Tax=Amycolatopsis orientalis TaxID=31958 RepID=UPI0012680B1A|nr:hypothetical protein [Amycolatopsis orientalis]
MAEETVQGDLDKSPDRAPSAISAWMKPLRCSFGVFDVLALVEQGGQFGAVVFVGDQVVGLQCSGEAAQRFGGAIFHRGEQAQVAGDLALAPGDQATFSGQCGSGVQGRVRHRLPVRLDRLDPELGHLISLPVTWDTAAHAASVCAVRNESGPVVLQTATTVVTSRIRIAAASTIGWTRIPDNGSSGREGSAAVVAMWPITCVCTSRTIVAKVVSRSSIVTQ